MNKKKLIIKVEKLNSRFMHISTKDHFVDMDQRIHPVSKIPSKTSYWIAFLVLSSKPHIKFYKQLDDQNF